MSESEDDIPMRDFIEVYKSMPELWNCKSEKYKNKNIRKKSYEKLLMVYKKVKSDANVEDVKRKISNMRTCYRRELKKHIQSQKSGAGADDIYAPSLWYFEEFSFLRDLEMPVPGRSNLSSDDEENFAGTPSKQVPTKIKKKCTVDVRAEFLKKATEHLESSKNKEIQDDAAVFANGWACMLRQMPPDQQLFAKQAVDEIMLLGRLNKLTLNFLNNANSTSTPNYFSQNISETSRSYSSTVASPRTVAVPLISPADPIDSVQFVPEITYNSVHDLFSDSQFQ